MNIMLAAIVLGSCVGEGYCTVRVRERVGGEEAGGDVVVRVRR
jgi:hypothetical protein